MQHSEKPFQKVLRMEELLRSGPKYTVDELSQKMGLDTRSVFRYMERIASTGRNIKAEIRNGRTKEYWIPQETQDIPSELIANLLRIDQTMTQSGVRKYHKILMQAAQQLDPRNIRPAAAKLEPEPFFHIDHGPFAEYSEAESLTSQGMDKILLAMQNNNPLRLQYQRTEQGQRKLQAIHFEPYFLSLRVGKLYLVGIQPEVSKRQLVSLVYKRIKMLTIEKGKTFERDSRISLNDFYKYCLGQWVPRGDSKKVEITLRIDEPWLMDLFQESHFNPPAELNITAKGGIAKLCLFDTPDLETWLFSLLPSAEVIQPKSLRERLRKRAESAAKQLI